MIPPVALFRLSICGLGSTNAGTKASFCLGLRGSNVMAQCGLPRQGP